MSYCFLKKFQAATVQAKLHDDTDKDCNIDGVKAVSFMDKVEEVKVGRFS